MKQTVPPFEILPFFPRAAGFVGTFKRANRMRVIIDATLVHSVFSFSRRVQLFNTVSTTKCAMCVSMVRCYEAECISKPSRQTILDVHLGY